MVVLYNFYLAWLFRIADRLGWRNGPECTTYVTRTDLAQLAKLSGFEVVRGSDILGKGIDRFSWKNVARLTSASSSAVIITES